MTTPRLQWKDFDGKDQVFPLTKAEIVIGRKGDADILIPSQHQHVSRLHAKIFAADQGHQILDMGSTWQGHTQSDDITIVILQRV